MRAFLSTEHVSESCGVSAVIVEILGILDEIVGVKEISHLSRRIAPAVDNVANVVDVAEAVKHVNLVRTKNENNLIERCVLGRKLKRLVDVGRAIKAHPTQIHVTIT